MTGWTQLHFTIFETTAMTGPNKEAKTTNKFDELGFMKEVLGSSSLY